MRFHYLFFPLLFLLTSCGGPVTKPSDNDRPFRTTAPSRLYFKNIRSTAYATIDNKQEGMDWYRFRKLPTEADAFTFIPVIVDHWLQDEAYIMFQFLGNENQSFAEPLTIQWQDDNNEGEFDFAQRDQAGQFEFARNLYTQLQQKNKLAILGKEGEPIPILENYKDRTYLLTILSDYFRLTENL
jgi:hypothetical protein